MTAKFLAIALVSALALQVTAAPHAVAPARRHPLPVPVPSTHRLHERGLPHWELTWTQRDRVPADLVLPMRIGLRQSNLDHGHDRLMDISDPHSPNYGKHMTPAEVVDFFAPSEDRVRAVTAWLESWGIEKGRVSMSSNKQVRCWSKLSESQGR